MQRKMKFDRSAARGSSLPKPVLRVARFEVNRASQKLDAVAHRSKAIRRRRRAELASDIEASSIVLYSHNYKVLPADQIDLHVSRTRMRRHIRESALQSFVERGLISRRQVDFQRRPEPDSQARSGSE